ncbi:acyl carrier protein, partial [Legionella parisiensis]
MRQTLCAIVADVLGLESGEEVGIKNDLLAMGMDSLM